MRAKIFVSIAIVLSVLIIAGFYYYYAMRAKSPVVETTLATDQLTVKVTYCSPSVRGRTVFGDESSLQPFGTYWRMGANEMTTIVFSDDVMVGEHVVPKGSYGLYAIPYEDKFEVRLNREFDRWGYSEPNYEEDIVREKVETFRSSDVVEQLEITLEEIAPNSMALFMAWEHYHWSISITTLDE